MNDASDDDLRALRDADPAGDAHASAALRERIAGIPGTDEVSPARRKRWLMPVAAAAAVVAAIGGGYAWGALGSPAATTASGGTNGSGTPVEVQTGTSEHPGAPIAPPPGSASGSGSSPASQNGGVPQTEFAAGDSRASTDVASSWIGGWWGEHHRFRLPPLDSAAGTAEVFAVDAASAYSAETAQRIATALGVAGTPHQPPQDQGWSAWIVGDDTAPQLNLDIGGYLSYQRTNESPWWVCDQEANATYPPDSADPKVWEQRDAAVRACLQAKPMPTETQVRDEMAKFLAAVGVDGPTTDLEITSDDYSRSMTASTSLIVADNATQLMATVSVNAGGVEYASAPYGDVVSLGGYAIVSPQEAGARLSDPAFTPIQTAWPEPETQEPTEYTPPTEPAPVPGAGSQLPWGISEHSIEAARLGFTLLTDTAGVQYLAPAYEFTASDGTAWSVIALTEADLDTTPTSYGWGIAY